MQHSSVNSIIDSDQPTCSKYLTNAEIKRRIPSSSKSTLCKKQKPFFTIKATGSKTTDNCKQNCIVCGEKWGSDAKLDFFLCMSCSNWACENCFLIDICINCDEN